MIELITRLARRKLPNKKPKKEDVLVCRVYLQLSSLLDKTGLEIRTFRCKYITDWHKWGKIGPSYLLSENSDLSFLLFFSKQCLVENFQGKFQKNSSVNLISEESP